MSFNNVDIIGSLPEEIRAHILSLMPTKFAVRTSILSREWRYSWTFVTSLDIFRDLFLNGLKFSSGNYPMPKSLSFEVSSRNDVGYMINIPHLKRLKLTLPYFHRYKLAINKVILKVPNLEYLYVGGTLCLPFVMEDMSSLVKACISFHHITSIYHLSDLLKGVSGVKSFSITKIPHTLLAPIFSIFPNMKHLELKSDWCAIEIIKVLERCPGLKHLHIEKPVSCRRSELQLVPACMLTNLTTIKFPKFKGEKRVMDFLKYMLGNAQVLKMVTIPWSKMRLAEQVLKFPRASGCEIQFR